MKNGLFIFLAILLYSCSSENGNSVVGDKLTVFYDAPVEEELAEQIAVFWKENDLLTGKKQDLKIVPDGDSFVLQIIASYPIDDFDMPFEERKLLLELEADLHEKITDYPIEIVICNNQFKPIYNID
ncbi:MAG TPA: hypothetical protein EYG86_03555 [Crocinitomicaceae bacterium]|nr:hypothetical protein [Crocinitomicaceae bacterium]